MSETELGEKGKKMQFGFTRKTMSYIKIICLLETYQKSQNVVMLFLSSKLRDKLDFS